MVFQVRWLLIVLLCTNNFYGMSCIKKCVSKYQQTDDSNARQVIHHHNYCGGTSTISSKVGMVLTTLALGSLTANTGLNISTMSLSAPTYTTHQAVPYNTHIDPSLLANQDLYANNCIDKEVRCSNAEIDNYSQLCEYHEQATNGTKVAKRLLTKAKRRAAALRNQTNTTDVVYTPCQDVCAKSDNPTTCADLALRDNAVVIRECTGHKNVNDNGTIFGLSTGSLVSNVFTYAFVIMLGIKASCSC